LIDFSRPGKPTDNAYIETFNGTLRDECLNINWFQTLAEARRLIEAWGVEYSDSRLHMVLGIIPPSEYGLRAIGSTARGVQTPSKTNSGPEPPFPSASSPPELYSLLGESSRAGQESCMGASPGCVAAFPVVMRKMSLDACARIESLSTVGTGGRP